MKHSPGIETEVKRGLDEGQQEGLHFSNFLEAEVVVYYHMLFPNGERNTAYIPSPSLVHLVPARWQQLLEQYRAGDFIKTALYHHACAEV